MITPGLADMVDSQPTVNRTRDITKAIVLVAPGGTAGGFFVTIGAANDGEFVNNNGFTFVAGMATNPQSVLLGLNVDVTSGTSTISVTPPTGLTCAAAPVTNWPVAASTVTIVTPQNCM